MVKAIQVQYEHSPTLNTVVMVEKALKNADSLLSVAELKRLLPRQVNHNTLKVVLEYLEQSNKIVFTSRGITWIHEPNQNLKKAIKRGKSMQSLNELASKSKLTERDAALLARKVNHSIAKKHGLSK